MTLKLLKGSRLLVATHNPGKAVEIAELLDGNFEVLAASELGAGRCRRKIRPRTDWKMPGAAALGSLPGLRGVLAAIALLCVSPAARRWFEPR